MPDRRPKKTRTPAKPVPLSMTPELEKQVRAAAGRTGLSLQQVMRLSLERGLPILEAQLTTPVTP